VHSEPRIGNGPVLRRSCKIDVGPNHTTIRHLRIEVSLAGAASAAFQHVQPYLDGERSVEQIAERSHVDAGDVAELVDALRSAGLLAGPPGAGDSRGMTGADFHALHHRYSRVWLDQVYEHPFWQRVIGGTATRAQVLGFAFEKYHYIEGAHEHMAHAAANATFDLMPHLARHFIEEYTHGDIYRAGLRHFFSDETILQSVPLPSTRSLLNFLNELACRDSFAYYAANEVLQMTENSEGEETIGAVNTFYEGMRKHYPYSEHLIRSFEAHTRLDQGLGHESVFREMCEAVPSLSDAQVRRAMCAARGAVEHLRLFMDGIDVFYARFPTIPRTANTVLSD
jgi:pyrroloquinoline quinone (PQQ) biosynthesis protein C